MSSIFLSHSHKDKLFARKLSDSLKEHGIRTWLDEAEMHVGDSLITKIGEAIRECHYLGVVISPHSVSSEWVRREVNIALTDEIQGKRIKVLPLLCQQCELPAFLADKIYADFTGDFNKGLETLLDRFRADIKTTQNQPKAFTGIKAERKRVNKLIRIGIVAIVLAAIIAIIYVKFPSTVQPQTPTANTDLPNTDAHVKSGEEKRLDDLPNSAPLSTNERPRDLANDNRRNNSSANNNVSTKRGELKPSNLGGMPSLLTSQLNQARKLLRQGDYPGAISMCDKVLNVDPQNSLAKKIKAEAINAENY